jgi:hypothetical protein
MDAVDQSLTRPLYLRELTDLMQCGSLSGSATCGQGTRRSASEGFGHQVRTSADALTDALVEQASISAIDASVEHDLFCSPSLCPRLNSSH